MSWLTASDVLTDTGEDIFRKIEDQVVPRLLYPRHQDHGIVFLSPC